MIWHFPNGAPNFVPLRVRVRSADGNRTRLRELPYLLVKDEDRWFYSRTMVPIYPWHKPALWSDTPRSDGEQLFFENELSRLWGDATWPSGRVASA